MSATWVEWERSDVSKPSIETNETQQTPDFHRLGFPVVQPNLHEDSMDFSHTLLEHAFIKAHLSAKFTKEDFEIKLTTTWSAIKCALE